MSFRYKDSDHLSPMGRDMLGRDSKFDDPRMMDDKRDDLDDLKLRAFNRGRRLSPPGRDKPFSDRPRDFPYGRESMPLGRDRSPLRGFEDKFKGDMPFPRRDDLTRKDKPFMDDKPRDRFMGGIEGRMPFGSPGQGNSRFEPGLEDIMRQRQMDFPGVQPYKAGFVKDPMKPNECEIIVINKLQRAYAENIEQRMKNLGILVDILFLKDEALLVQTIDDIARRGSLFAMVISPLNETHRSVTLNILYGTPQEHRNMPTDEALKLVARNFHDHILTRREVMDRDRMERGFFPGSSPADREIQFLLRLLADGRQVSIGEMDTVLKYLQERREKMKVPSTGPTSSEPPAEAKPEIPKVDTDIAKKEQDLQNRIMNIINQGPTEGNSTEHPATSLPPSSGTASSSTGGSALPGLGGDGPSSRSMQPPGGKMDGPSGPSQNQPNVGPNSQNIGPNSQNIGPNSQNMGPNSQNMGPNSQNMGPRMGPNQPGPGFGNQQPPGNQMNRNMNKDQGPGPGPMGGNMPGMSENRIRPNQGQSSPYINFDNPSVKQALDNLMQSGPNLLKNISMGSNQQFPSGDRGMHNDSPNKMAPGNMGGQVGPQRGGLGGMGEMGRNMGPMQGNMGPMQGGNMGPHGGNMGPSQGGNMGPPMGGGMGPMQNYGMGPRGQGPNMGPGPMGGNMGPGSQFPGPQGMYGGRNMMGNRPPFMGGPMGGPRRY